MSSYSTTKVYWIHAFLIDKDIKSKQDQSKQSDLMWRIWFCVKMQPSHFFKRSKRRSFSNACFAICWPRKCLKCEKYEFGDHTQNSVEFLVLCFFCIIRKLLQCLKLCKFESRMLVMHWNLQATHAFWWIDCDWVDLAFV